MKLLRLLPVLLALSGAAWGQRVDNPPGMAPNGANATSAALGNIAGAANYFPSYAITNRDHLEHAYSIG